MADTPHTERTGNPPAWGDFCCWCGQALAQTAFPRACANGHMTFNNGQPVGVALQPVTNDNQVQLLVVKRGIPPFVGEYALPGGFKENTETFGQCAARELYEETGVQHSDPIPVTFYQTVGTPHRSGTDPRLPYLQFETLPALQADHIDLAFRSAETLGLATLVFDATTDTLRLADGTPVTLCFPLHDTAARLFLQQYL